MRFVQLLLTDKQAELCSAALTDAAENLKEELSNVEVTSEQANDNERVSEDIRAVGRLQLLFEDASARPSKYPPTGKAAATVRSIVRRSKGASQPPRKNKRKQRQEKRRAWNQQRRKFRREFAEESNKAQAIMEAEQAEHEANVAELQARTAEQPKYTVTDGFGNPVMSEIPAEFIVDSDGNSLIAEKKSKIKLPFRKGG